MKFAMKGNILAITALTHSCWAQQNKHHRPIQSRIIGGFAAEPNAFPYFTTVDTSSNALCGASLIHPDILLTAAHCAGAFSNGVRIGAHNLDDPSDGVHRMLTQEILHPNYDAATMANDIMLLKIDKTVDIQPVLWEQSPSAPIAGEILTVMGFGATSDGGDISSVLLQVDVSAVHNDACNEQYGGDVDLAVMFCAGVPGGGQDSCQGASGGPIIDQNNVQIGIVSWGVECASATHSGVYTRVGAFAEWIEDMICQHSSHPSSDLCNANTNTNSNHNNVHSNSASNINSNNHSNHTIRSNSANNINTNSHSNHTIRSYSASNTNTNNHSSHTTNNNTNDHSNHTTNNTGERVVEGRAGGSGTVTSVRVEISFDGYPQDTFWQLYEGCAECGYHQFVTAGPYNYIPAPFDKFQTTLNLLSGLRYTFMIQDTYGDGFAGKVAIYLIGSNGQETLLASGPEARSQHLSTILFQVPLTMGPARSVCTDGTGDFPLEVGASGNCTTLSSTPELNYLCGYVDVALACPRTCGVCEDRKTLLQEEEKGCDSDSPGTVDMGDMVGERTCEWLKLSVTGGGRLASLCNRKSVAFHCPATCGVCDRLK